MCYDKPRRRSLATSSPSSSSLSSSSHFARSSKIGPTSSPSLSTATLLSNPSFPASTLLAPAIPTTTLPDLQLTSCSRLRNSPFMMVELEADMVTEKAIKGRRKAAMKKWMIGPSICNS
ncbi:hypothetical protein ACFX2G_042054 [Malus domestica]